jgi:hypothetical protein
MKSYRTITILFILLLSLILSVSTNSQQPEDLYAGCFQQINDGYIPDGQPMKALLTGTEVAEFRTTLFDGNTYRISTCSPSDKKIWFSVYDSDKRLLFSSAQQNQSSFWDFKMEGNLECIIEAGLMPGKGDSGMALLLVGFKKSEDSF